MMKLFSELYSNICKVIIYFLSLVVVVRQDIPIAIMQWRYWLPRVCTLSLPYDSPKMFAVLSFCKLFSPIRVFRVTYQSFDAISSGFIQVPSVYIFVDFVEFQKTITFVLFSLYFIGYPCELVFFLFLTCLVEMWSDTIL